MPRTRPPYPAEFREEAVPRGAPHAPGGPAGRPPPQGTPPTGCHLHELAQASIAGPSRRVEVTLCNEVSAYVGPINFLTDQASTA